MKVRNPIRYPTRGLAVTPISTVLRAATRIVTTYECGLQSCSVFYKKVIESHSIFTPLSQSHQQSQAVFGRSQIVSQVSAAGDVPFMLTMLTSIFLEVVEN